MVSGRAGHGLTVGEFARAAIRVISRRGGEDYGLIDRYGGGQRRAASYRRVWRAKNA